MNIEANLRDIVNTLGINLVEIPDNINYWLIRTYSGKYYATFLSQKFVGIGWAWEKNLCETEKIKPSHENYTSAVKQYKHSSYYSRIIATFNDTLNINDVVICPAYRSSKVLLGRIISDVVFQDDYFPYPRTRAVEWIKEIDWTDIPQKMFRFLSTQHGMCSANDIAPEVDRLMYPFYTSKGKAYLTLKVQQQDSISLRSVHELITFLLEKITKDEVVFFKTELCSPGFMQFLGTPKGIIILAIFLHFIVGGKIEINPKTLTISNETKGIIGTLLDNNNRNHFEKSLRELQIDLEPFNTKSNDIKSPDMEMKFDKKTQEP